MADVGSIFVRFLSDTSGFKKGNAEVQAGLKTTQQAASGFGTAMKALGPLIAGAFSVTAVINFGKASVQAWDESERAAAKLLAVTKGNTAETQRLIANAGALQGKTLFNDEDIQNAQLMLKSLGLTADQIIRITPLVADLATKLGMDLGSAGNLVAKSIGSSTNALVRYGIEIEGAAGSSERFDSAVEGLTRQVYGLAEAAAGAGVGSATQFKNAWDDIKELIGARLGPAVAAMAADMKAMAELRSGTGQKNYATELKEQARAALEGAKSTEEANERLREQTRLIEANIEKLEQQKDSIRTTPVKGIEIFNLGASVKVTKAQIKGAKDAITEINAVIEKGTALEWVPVKKDIIIEIIDTLGEMEAKISELRADQKNQSIELAKQTQLEINGWEEKIKAVTEYGKAKQKAYRAPNEMKVLETETLSSVGIVSIDKQLAPSTTDLTAAQKEYNASVKEAKQITIDFTSQAVSGFQDIGGAIGQLLSGESSIQGFFANILKAVAQFMQEFGAAMIAAAAAKLEFDATLGLAPPLAIAAGIGLVAAGVTLQGLANKGMKGYADGVIAYGPTVGMFGEYAGARSNPEVVAPLSKLKQMIGANIQGELRIRGRDLVYVLGEEINFGNRT